MMKNLSLIRPPSGDGGLTIVEASSDQKAEQTVAHGAADHAVWLKQCRSPRPGERSRYANCVKQKLNGMTLHV